jgi:5-hydroxyisourate hydrolase
MPGVSIHVVDVAHGVVATGMRVELFTAGAQPRAIASGVIGRNGLLNAPELAAEFAPGRYEAAFHVGEYYRQTGEPLPTVPFLDVVRYEFGIADAQQHYHLPFKVTPWGYSCFRGGA